MVAKPRDEDAWVKLQGQPARRRYEHADTFARRVSLAYSFRRRVSRHASGCWTWSGAMSAAGEHRRHPMFYHRRDPRPNNETSSRSAFLWMMTAWFPESGIQRYDRTVQTCGNDRCISPYHRANLRVTSRTTPRMTTEVVLALYALKGSMSLAEAGDKFGVTQAAVQKIWAGRTWSSVTGQKFEPAPYLRKEQGA